MAYSIKYKDITLAVGDTISLVYKIKEGDKERQQTFKGILIRVKGADEANRMITIRKMSKSGVGIERIFPLISPFIEDIKLSKKGVLKRAKAYFIRNLSDSELRHKLYRQK